MYPSGTGEGDLVSAKSGVRLCRDWSVDTEERWGEGSGEEGEDRLEVGLGELFMDTM